MLGSDYQPEQSKILGDAILAATTISPIRLNKTGTVDTPVPYRMSEVLRHLDVAMGAPTGQRMSALSGIAATASGSAVRCSVRFVFASA